MVVVKFPMCRRECIASEKKTAKHCLDSRGSRLQASFKGDLTSRGRGLWVREDDNATLTLIDEFLQGHLLPVICLNFAAKIVKVDGIT